MFGGDDGGMFDGIIPDITGDGKSDLLDAFLINEMINDTEDQENQGKKVKNLKKTKLKKSKKKANR